MTFPVYFPVAGHRVHPHLMLEIIAYAAGFQLYLLLRRRGVFPRAKLPFEQNVWMIVACIFGALIGSKLLAFLESFHQLLQMGTPLAFLGGKTIVGGLLGGWIGVEIAKRFMGIRQSTGDVYVFPLILGMSIGRIGCFLTGLSDHTYGVHTDVPWAVDFGDGPRHPTQLYDIVFLTCLAAILTVLMCRPRANGALFRGFMLAYLLWRLVIEHLKPRELLIGHFSAIQLTCLLGAVCCVISLGKGRNRSENDFGTVNGGFA